MQWLFFLAAFSTEQTALCVVHSALVNSSGLLPFPFVYFIIAAFGLKFIPILTIVDALY